MSKEEPYDLVGDKGRIKIASWENWLEYYWNLYKKTNKLKHLEKFDWYKNKIRGIEGIARQVIRESTKRIFDDEILESRDLFCKQYEIENIHMYNVSSLYSLRTDKIAGKDLEKQKQK